MKVNSTYLALGILYFVFIFWACSGTSFPQGKRLYEVHCANCHMDDGTGLSQLLPSLAESDAILGVDINLPCLIKTGKGLESNEGRTLPMPQFSSLSNVEVNNIVNFLRTSWGHQGRPLSLKEIESALNDCSH